MLILRRKEGESIIIGDQIQITVMDLGESGVRLAIDAPKEVRVLRSELIHAMDANRDAADGQAQPEQLLAFLGKHADSKAPKAPET